MSGHLHIGQPMHFRTRHEACALCGQPFEGQRQQKVCDACRAKPEFAQWYRRNQERYALESRKRV